MYRWLCITASSLAILGSGYAIIEGGIIDILEQHREITTYEPVQAQVISAEIRKHYSKFKGKKVVNYKPFVEYKYLVNGDEYASNRVRIIHRYGYSWSKKIVESYAEGKTIEAYYDPEEPSRAFLLKEYSFRPYALTLTFLPFMAMGVGMAIWIWSEWFKRKAPIAQQNGWFELVPEMTNKAKVIGSACVTVLWHTVGIVISGHYFIIAHAPYGLGPVMVVAIYEVVGCIPLFFLVRFCLLIRKVGDAHVFIDHGQLTLGNEIMLHSEQVVRGEVHVKQSYLSLACEKAVSTHGRRWNISRLCEKVIDGPRDHYSRRKDIIKISNTCVLPVEGEPSSHKNEGNPRYKWYIEAVTRIINGPDYKAKFPISVQAREKA